MTTLCGTPTERPTGPEPARDLQSTETYDPYFLARPGTVTYERRKDSQTTAEPRR
jgi:hypothetical protein